MSNEPEIGKEMSEEEKMAGISDISQNNVQIQQIAKDSSEIININNEPSNLTVTTNITDRIQIQETILENENRLKAIIQGLSIAAFVVDSDHRVLYWNKALEVLSNIRAEEIIGTTNQWKAFYIQKRPCMADILIDGGLDDVEKWYAGRYKKSSLLDDSFEATDFFPNLGSDGKWLRFTATVIRNTNGDLIGVLETLEDISESKKAEEEIKKEKETAQQYLDIAGSILLVLDTTGNIDLVNKKGCEILDGTSDELTGQNWFDHFLLKEDKEKVKAVFYTLMRGEIEPPVEYNDNRIVSKKGTEKWVRWHNTVIRNKDGQIIGTLSSGEDITERKRVEEDLWIKDRAIASSFNGVAISDLNGKLIYINDAFSCMWGYTVQDALNLNVADLDSDKNEIIHIINDIKEKGFSLGESVAIRNDGSLFNIQYSASLVTNSLGKPIAMLSTFVDITEHKRAEDALRRSEEQYRLVTENASDAIWTMDLNFKFTYISPSNEKMTGYTTEKALKLSLDEILTPESIERAMQTFNTEMQLENSEEKDLSRSVILELNQIRADGTIFPIEIRMCSLRDTHANQIGILGITRDITERKKTEDALKKSEEKFVKAFKSSPVAIAITRMSDGKFVEINESLVKLFGYSHAELLAGSSIGLGLWMDNDDRKHVVEELNKNGSLYDYEYRFRTNDGKVIVARYSAEIIDFSGERCILSVLIDVTEKKRAEESLRESEEKYRSIVENTQDVIMLTNPDGRVSYMSPACVDVLGYNPNELIGKILEIFYPDDVEKVHTALSSAIQGSSGSNLEYRILTKNGTTKWVSHSWSPMLTENHVLKCIVSVVRDITESKIAEQILKMKIEELEKYKNVTMNREVKMIDLKNEINELCKQLNQKPKYLNV